MQTLFKRIAATAAAAAVLTSGTALAMPQQPERVTLIVELKGESVLEAQAARDMGAELFIATDEAQDMELELRTAQEDVQSEIRSRIDADAEVGYTYTHTFNGFSIEVYESDIEAIRNMPEVENVYISESRTVEEPETDGDIYIDPACEEMGVDYMHKNGYTGKGMVIAVIDNGFDKNHEIFKGRMPEDGNKLSKDAVMEILPTLSTAKDARGAMYVSTKIPYAYDYQGGTIFTKNYSSSHGTHVAGIAAGNNGTDPDGKKFVGAAPDAQLLLMACPSLMTDDVVAAIDDAVKLGADVINASYSKAYQEISAPEEKAISAAVNAGVLFSSSAGNKWRGYNSGETAPENIDYGSPQTPSYIKSATAVASAESRTQWELYYEMQIDGSTIMYGSEIENPSFADYFSIDEEEKRFLDDEDIIEFRFIYAPNASEEELAGAEDKIAVIKRDEKSFADKYRRLQEAEVGGVIIINNEHELSIGIDDDILNELQTAVVYPEAEEIFKNAQEKGNTIVGVEDVQKGRRKTAKLEMNTFSSWGVASGLDLDPDITAPGGNIYSSVNNDKYNNKSGTSMSAPHMAGASALMKQYINAHPAQYGDPAAGQMPRVIENALMSTADTVMQDNDIPYSPRLQGAGLVNLEKAAGTSVTLIGDNYNGTEKSKVSLHEVDENISVRFRARNLSDTAVSYDTVSVTVFTDDTDEKGHVAKSKPLTVTGQQLPEGVTIDVSGETEVEAKLTLDKAELDNNLEVFRNGFYIDGFVYLSDSAGVQPALSIPFMGFYGEWESAPALDREKHEEGSVLKDTYLKGYTNMLAIGSRNPGYYEYELGTNIFAYSTDPDYEEYSSAAFCGISPNGDHDNDGLTFMLTPLRALGEAGVRIYDKDDKIVYENDTLRYTNGDPMTFRKFTNSTVYQDEKMAETVNGLPDGDYRYELSSGFAGRKEYEKNESVSARFYIDRTRPEITGYELKENEGKLMLTVTAADDRHLMGIIAGGNKDGEPVARVKAIKAEKGYTAEFDMTGIDPDSIYAVAVDYAMNSSIRSNAEGTLTAFYDGRFGGAYGFHTVNTTDKSYTGTVIAAFYEDGRLKGLSYTDTALGYGVGNIELRPGALEFDKIKLMMWDDLNKMIPEFKAFEFKKREGDHL